MRQRPVDDVVEDIRRSGRHHIFIVDDNLFVNAEKARELFEALIPLNVTWSCQVSIDIARDADLVRLMARSGCISALIGFESLDPESLREIKKGWNVKWQSYDDAVDVFRQAGIMLYGTFVFGCDNDTVESFDRSVEFATRNKFMLANFNPLTPTPGAPLFERMQREGRLLHERWWLDDDFSYGDATMLPKNMTPTQLTEGCFAARRKFNQAKSIMYRLFDSHSNFRSPYRAGYIHVGKPDLEARDLQQAEPTSGVGAGGSPHGACGVKVTFLRPNIGRLANGPYIDEGRMEPLTLGVVAAYTPADVECVLYDDRMEDIPFDEPTDLAAITVELYNARRSYEIAAEYRKRGVPVVMGGFQPTLVPDECLEHADAIVTDDAETIWPTVVNDARNGQLAAHLPRRNGLSSTGWRATTPRPVQRQRLLAYKPRAIRQGLSLCLRFLLPSQRFSNVPRLCDR